MKNFQAILFMCLLFCNTSIAQKITIPVHIHIIDINEKGFKTKTKESHIKRDFKIANRIWTKVNIFWEIKKIDKIKGNTDNTNELNEVKKWLTKNFVSKYTKGTTSDQLGFQSLHKAFLLKISKAENYKLHTKRINIYYLPNLGIKKKPQEICALTLSDNHTNPITGTVSFTDISKNVGRNGIIFISHRCPNRGKALAHELGHILRLEHAEKFGKDLMTIHVEGTYISKETAEKGKAYYKKYLQKLLK